MLHVHIVVYLAGSEAQLVDDASTYWKKVYEMLHLLKQGTQGCDYRLTRRSAQNRLFLPPRACEGGLTVLLLGSQQLVMACSYM